METNLTSLSELGKNPKFKLDLLGKEGLSFTFSLDQLVWVLIIHKFYINDKEEKFFTFHNLDIKIVLHSLFTAVYCLI